MDKSTRSELWVIEFHIRISLVAGSIVPSPGTSPRPNSLLLFPRTYFSQQHCVSYPTLQAPQSLFVDRSIYMGQHKKLDTSPVAKCLYRCLTCPLKGLFDNLSYHTCSIRRRKASISYSKFHDHDQAYRTRQTSLSSAAKQYHKVANKHRDPSRYRTQTKHPSRSLPTETSPPPHISSPQLS